MHYLQQPVFIRKTRLQSVQHWMLYPIFLSSLYLCVSLSHALSIPNPRVDSHTYVPHLPDTVILETQPPEMAFQGIWLAIHPVSQGILIQVPGEIPLVWDKNPSTSAEISLQLTGMQAQPAAVISENRTLTTGCYRSLYGKNRRRP